MAIDVGQEAPDFTLRDQKGHEVTLSSFRGKKNVVLVFYPLTFTAVCEGELCTLRDELEVYDSLDAQVLAVSVDSSWAHRKWAQERGFTFPLLADFWPHGEVARAYGVFEENLGFATRGTFVIDRDGIVRYKVVNPPPQARDTAEYKKALAEIG